MFKNLIFNTILAFILFACRSNDTIKVNHSNDSITEINSESEFDKIQTGIYRINKDSANSVQIEFEGNNDKYFLNPIPIVTVAEFESVSVFQNSNGKYSIAVLLDKIGTKKFLEASSDLIGQQLAIVVLGRIHSAPIVEGIYTDGYFEINNSTYTMEKCYQTVAEIKAEMNNK